MKSPAKPAKNAKSTASPAKSTAKRATSKSATSKSATAKSTTAKGRDGEDVACLHLERLGYDIVGRNVRTKGGELDVVARDGEILCFVEVRRRAQTGDALLSIDERKQARLVRAALAYLATLSAGGGRVPYCRFDVVTVAGTTVDVLRNAFTPSAPPEERA